MLYKSRQESSISILDKNHTEHKHIRYSYTCGFRHCSGSKYKKNEDWGYFKNTSDDCHSCQERCNEVSNCTAVECGGTQCTWWKDEKCGTIKERTVHNQGFMTCIKHDAGIIQ